MMRECTHWRFDFVDEMTDDLACRKAYTLFPSQICRSP